MDSDSFEDTMKNLLNARPRLVLIASSILAANALILLIWWVFSPTGIQSNGVQVFFMIVWLAVSYAIYYGQGWVRYALIFLTVVFVGEMFNARESFFEFFAAMSFDEKLTKLLCVGCIVLLFTKESNQWYKSTRATRKSIENAHKSQNSTT